MEVTTMAQAMQLHAQALKLGSQPHYQDYSKLFTFSALSPSGDLSYARLILDSLDTPNSYYWNTMLRAYADSPNPHLAISMFMTMHLQGGGFGIAPRPNNFTYPFVLKACGRIRDAQMGKGVHCLVCKVGFGCDKYVCNAMVSMYGKCGEFGSARKVFDEMPERDVVSWTSLIDGFVDGGRGVEAIGFFEEMVESGVEGSDATFVAVLRACAETGALEMGRKVHRVVEELGIGEMCNVCAGLVDMYSKCGCIDSAREVFEKIVDKDVFCWTAMIQGLASHGRSKEAVVLFEEMLASGVEPDERTMSAVLAACRNAGWTSEGCLYLNDMRERYGIMPNLQHYGCIVDLYARSGRLEEAEDFIRKMPIVPDAVLWRTLVWACKVHADFDRAERLIKEFNINFDDHSNSLLISNMYASSGKWHEKVALRKTLSRQGVSKPPGSSKIEVDGRVHEFTSGETNHIEAHDIFKMLKETDEKLRGVGYKPEVSEALLEMDDEDKAFQLLHHTEKLALAYGLIKTEQGSPIRIVKNLRSCEDCHSFMKLVSRIYEREIVVRDRIRFHHFRNGDCSCGDCW